MLWKTLLVIFLAVNALFWGLADHGSHCNVARMLGVSNCPPHWVHLTTGVVAYLLALVVAQYQYLFKK